MATRDYAADGLTIHWDSSLCYHAAECIKAQPAVFDPNRRPWILTDDAPGDGIAAAIDACPSGALRYTRNGDEGAPAEAVVTISTRASGPLLVKGPVTVVDDHGAVVQQATQLAFCRCGASGNKPYCDGAHKAAGFSDPGIIDTHPGTDA